MIKIIQYIEWLGLTLTYVSLELLDRAIWKKTQTVFPINHLDIYVTNMIIKPQGILI